jgi:hypothetical protein
MTNELYYQCQETAHCETQKQLYKHMIDYVAISHLPFQHYEKLNYELLYKTQKTIKMI